MSTKTNVQIRHDSLVETLGLLTTKVKATVESHCRDMKDINPSTHLDRLVSDLRKVLTVAARNLEIETKAKDRDEAKPQQVAKAVAQQAKPQTVTQQDKPKVDTHAINVSIDKAAAAIKDGSKATLRKACQEFGLSDKGGKPSMLERLTKFINTQQAKLVEAKPKAVTMGDFFPETKAEQEKPKVEVKQSSAASPEGKLPFKKDAVEVAGWSLSKCLLYCEENKLTPPMGASVEQLRACIVDSFTPKPKETQEEMIARLVAEGIAKAATKAAANSAAPQTVAKTEEPKAKAEEPKTKALETVDLSKLPRDHKGLTSITKDTLVLAARQLGIKDIPSNYMKLASEVRKALATLDGGKAVTQESKPKAEAETKKTAKAKAGKSVKQMREEMPALFHKLLTNMKDEDVAAIYTKVVNVVNGKDTLI